MLLRARRQLPEPRGQPAPSREPRVPCGRRGTKAPTSAWPSTATPTAASSSTRPGEPVPADLVTALLAARSSPRTAPAVIYDLARAGWSRRRSSAAGGEPRSPGRPFLHQAPCARRRRRSAASSRATSTSGTSPATRASSPAFRARPDLARGRTLSEILEPTEPLPRHGRDQLPRGGRHRESQLNEPFADGRPDDTSTVFRRVRRLALQRRPSNTEPLLRLNLEALSEPLMEQKRDEVVALIRSS